MQEEWLTKNWQISLKLTSFWYQFDKFGQLGSYFVLTMLFHCYQFNRWVLKVIVLAKNTNNTKKGLVTTCVLGDDSGFINCVAFFGANQTMFDTTMQVDTFNIYTYWDVVLCKYEMKLQFSWKTWPRRSCVPL